MATDLTINSVIVFESVWKSKDYDRNCSDTLVFWEWLPSELCKKYSFAIFATTALSSKMI